MIDRSIMSDAPVPSNGNAHPDPTAPAALEQRVRRLEDVVAGIQDTRQLEERIVERVSDRIQREPKHAMKESLVHAGRQLLLLGCRSVQLPSGQGHHHRRRRRRAHKQCGTRRSDGAATLARHHPRYGPDGW